MNIYFLCSISIIQEYIFVYILDSPGLLSLLFQHGTWIINKDVKCRKKKESKIKRNFYFLLCSTVAANELSRRKIWFIQLTFLYLIYFFCPCVELLKSASTFSKTFDSFKGNNISQLIWQMETPFLYGLLSMGLLSICCCLLKKLKKMPRNANPSSCQTLRIS